MSLRIVGTQASLEGGDYHEPRISCKAPDDAVNGQSRQQRTTSGLILIGGGFCPLPRFVELCGDRFRRMQTSACGGERGPGELADKLLIPAVRANEIEVRTQLSRVERWILSIQLRILEALNACPLRLLCRPLVRRRAVNRHLHYASDQGVWPPRALNSLPVAVSISTRLFVQLLTSSDHAHTTD